MANRVNFAGNVIALEHGGMDKSLKEIEHNVQKCSSNCIKSFKKLASTDVSGVFNKISEGVKGFASRLGIGSLSLVFNEITGNVKGAEQAVSSFVAVTGSLPAARSLFDELNNVSREIPQSFDEITQSALILNKTGLKPTADNIKSLAAISIGTGQSITSVAQAFGNAAMGRLRSLQQLGITAVQEGDKLKLTYQGVTETIKADTQSLMGYMNSLAENKFGETIEYQMNGLTGATKLWGEAWGDIFRTIGESGVGQIISDAMRLAVNAIDSVTEALNSPAWARGIESVRQMFWNLGEAIGDIFGQVGVLWNNFLDAFSENAEGEISIVSEYFSNFFVLVNGGIVALGKSLTSLVQLTVGFGESIGRALAPDQLKKMAWAQWEEKAKAGEVNLNDAQGFQEYLKNYNVTGLSKGKSWLEQVSEKGAEIDAALDKFMKDTVDAGVKHAQKLTLQPGLNGNGANNPIGNGDGSSGGKGGGSNRLEADRHAFDQLAQSLERARIQSLSALQQEEIEYQKHMATITDAMNRRVVSEQEAKALLEQVEFQHQENLNKIRQDAEVKLAEMRGDPIAKLQMQYSQELEALEQLHADKLASEEVYLQSMTALYDRYYSEISKKNEKGKKGKDGKKDASILGISTEALDSVGKSLDMVSGAFSQMTANMNESSGAYKALFAVEKSFALASAMVNGMAAIGKGMSTAKTWYEWAAVYAQAIAMVGNIVSTISSVSMHDKGGSIPAGQYGIVGEIGPELVRGPASVTSRKDTADLLSHRGGDVIVNLIEDASRAGQVEKEDTDEATIIQVCVANIHRGGELADAISNTYGVARQGV